MVLIAAMAMASATASTTAAAPASFAQIVGQWTAEAKRGGGLYFGIERRESGHHMSSSGEISLSAFQGLDASAMASNGGVVRFRLVREAGVFECEGWFKDGRGAGTFAFVPAPGFESAMRDLGYEGLSGEDVFTFAVFDIGPTLVREYAGLGYDRIDRDDLVAMRIHGATLDFVHELDALGYKHVGVEDLVAMRIHGVSPEFIHDLGALGYDHVNVEDLVAMRIHGVTIDYIKRQRERGHTDVSVEELIDMRIHGR